MSRCGYCEDFADNWSFIRWRGAVTSAIKGKRGQAFLKELLEALDALPVKKLIANELVTPSGEVCAIGSVALKRNVDTSNLDIYDSENIAKRFGISDAMVREIEYINDEKREYVDGLGWRPLSDERRFEIVRAWVVQQIIVDH